MLKSLFLSFVFYGSSGAVAVANGGHIGELAGHAHWVGLLAGLGAAGLAAAVLATKIRNGKQGSREGQPNADEEAEADGVDDLQPEKA